MDNTIRVFSGRTFSPEDIKLIQWALKTYSRLSYNEQLATICEILDWKTPAGRPKMQQCGGFLDQLESEHIIELPTRRKITKLKKTPTVSKFEFDTSTIQGDLHNFDPIKLEIAYVGDDLRRWASYVDQYHMLGYKQVFGSRLHYFIKVGDKELGCLQFSASSWALEGRDKWIGWTIADKKERLHLIINNSRYLIFPWVNIKNLASKALSIAAKQIQDDWLREFCYAPVLLETFVDRAFFKGTCYKAANWTYLGQTKGRGRLDRDNTASLSVKDIYMYPLQKDFKECLRGEKPYKVVDPDEQ